jgi:dolichol-phosphate mannosyltransferase
MSSKKEVCLVIPVYNEAASIEISVVALLPDQHEYTLLFVDDGSTDATQHKLRKLLRQHPFELIAHESNQGYGAACRSGGQWAISNNFDWIIFADSDLTNPPNEIRNLAILILQNDFDVHKASRETISANIDANFLKRRILSEIARTFSSWFIGSSIHDPTNGFRAVRANLYGVMELKSNDFSIILEEDCEYLRHSAKIRNFPSKLGTRDQSQRKSSFRYDVKLLLSYVYWCFRCLMSRLHALRNKL